MNVNYLNDSDLDFLQHCSEEQLANFARLLTHNEKGKTRLSSVLMRNELFKSMEGHPERHRRNWQLIAGELQHFGFKAARSASQSLNIPSEIKEGQTTDWININSDNDNKRCVSKITFSGHTVNSSDMATLKIIGDD